MDSNNEQNIKNINNKNLKKVKKLKKDKNDLINFKTNVKNLEKRFDKEK